MGSSDRLLPDPAHVPQAGTRTPDVRIDPAHPSVTGGPEKVLAARADRVLAVAGESSVARRAGGETGVAAERLSTQANQLAEQLSRQQEGLERREAEIAAQAAELEANLGRARAWFAQREADLLKLRQRWIEEHRREQAELDAARRQFEEERRRDRADLQEKRRSLERRTEQVDRDSVALERTRQVVARAHREALLAQLAHEQLRAELAPQIPAEVQRQALEQIRSRISEEYREASRALSHQKRQLLALRRELAEQHRTARQQCEELHRLAAQAASRRT